MRSYYFFGDSLISWKSEKKDIDSIQKLSIAS